MGILIGLLVFRIIILAAILRVVLRLMAKNEADLSWEKVVMVTAAMNLGVFLMENFSVGQDPRLVFGLKLACVTFLIMTFLWVSLWRTLLVIVVYIILQLGIGHGLKVMLEKVVPPEKHELLDREVRREKVREKVDQMRDEAYRKRGVKPPEK